MQEAYINICAACRKKAHMTQEQWAEAGDGGLAAAAAAAKQGDYGCIW